jgi:polyhydroxybutyrate depolymerase
MALVGLACAAGAALLVSCAFEQPPDPDVPTLRFESLTWDGLERTFATYSPTSLAEPAAVVFLLHGGFSDATAIWNSELGRSWKALADANGFLLVLPEGRPDPGDPSGHHWNDCRVDIGNADSASTEDDVGFIGHVIDVVEGRFATAPQRIYVTGASNGGMMTYRLAMQSGKRFAAAAAIIANLPDPSECAFVADPLPLLIMNGTLDPAIPYNGGCVAGPSCERGSVRSTAATVALWVLANGASVTPAVTDLPDLVPSDDSTVRVFRFDGGASGNDVVLYRVDGGGHCPPGPDPFPATQKNRDIDAATEVWQFFEQHVRRVS